ncbi:MAG TPA: hypothetical protein VJR89_16530 [Polyangiales bacterium]|nr:hypothetical protein [Polyangiales bacterium]
MEKLLSVCEVLAVGVCAFALAGRAQAQDAGAAETPAVETPDAGIAPAEPAPPAVEPAAPAPASVTVVAAEQPEAKHVEAATAPVTREEPRSWFWRPPLRAEFGDWSVTLYGFAEADFSFDSTRSYDDAIGATLVARSDTYPGQVGRTQFSVRNSRLGLMFASPSIGGVKGSALLEADFFGTPAEPPGSGGASEHAFFDSPLLRLRQAYLQLQNAYVDVLAGHTYTVFGFQNAYSPCTLEFLGLPNQLFSRSTQLRLSHEFFIASELSIDVAAAAVRPAQRDSAVPDAQAGVRLNAYGWKGITTPGNTGTRALPLSIAVSATVRQFKVNAFTPPPTQRSNSATGWGVSVDAFVPIIPAAHGDDRSNRLSLLASFVTGTGIGDLITSTGGASFPTLPNPAQANPPPEYAANIDDGLVSFDTQGVVHTIDWWALRAGLQYYLPPSGRFILSANYTLGHSGNMDELFPKGGAEIELLTRVADRSQYADLNVMWDATPAIRFGLSGQYTKVDYLDGDEPHNVRVMGQALYAF